MPTYNGAKYISKSLDSILNQSYRNFNLIISDDGSTDSTIEIIKSYTTLDSRVSIMLHANLGNPWANWADGPKLIDEHLFFMWACQDDLWSSNYLELNIRNIIKHGYSASMGLVVNIDLSGTELCEVPSSRFRHSYVNSKSRRYRLFRFSITDEAKGKCNLIFSIMRTDFLRRLNLPDERTPIPMSFDNVIARKMIALAPIGFQDETYFFKRVGSSSHQQAFINDEEKDNIIPSRPTKLLLFFIGKVRALITAEFYYSRLYLANEPPMSMLERIGISIKSTYFVLKRINRALRNISRLGRQ
jgi:glycosyltransferase involved in cell wall biosynthesis